MCCSASVWLSAACWVCMICSPSRSPVACRLSLASSGWRRGVRPESGAFPTQRSPAPHLWAPTPYGRRSLRPVAEDDPGEMGGRVARLTFVGRVEELQTLDAVRGRAADGEPAVVLVGGEASVGKIRLVAELTSRCAADGTRVWSAAACRPTAGGPAVATVKTVLRPTHQTTGRARHSTAAARGRARYAPSGDVITTRLCTRIRYTRGPLFASVAVETRCDSAHDEVLCHRSR
jgi:hypothetical protein